jgi:hypothetical protein
LQANNNPQQQSNPTISNKNLTANTTINTSSNNSSANNKPKLILNSSNSPSYRRQLIDRV